MDSNGQNKKAEDQAYDILTKDILELLGAEKMTAAEKATIYNKMLQTIQNRILVRIVDALTEEQYAEFKKILEENNEEKFAEFYQKTGLDLAQLYAEEALLYKIEIVNLVDNSSDQNDQKED